MEDDSTSKTILLWKRLTHPKQVISLHQIHALESNLKLPVDPLIVGDLNADQSWGEWDDEVKDKKVAYMYDLIWASHQFQKIDWPGGNATLPPISIPKNKLSGVHKKHIVDRKKKLGVKSEAPKSKLISELQTKVEELSNRVMKLEKTKKAVRFKRSTKLSSSFVACSSRSKRKKTMEVPIQSQTPEPEVAQQVTDDNLDKAQDSSDSTPLINTEITDDPMDVFVTPLQSEHSNNDDANEGNPVYDIDVKYQNANEEDVDSQMQVDPSSNPSVEKLVPLNQDHISDDASERVPAIHSGLDLSKEHNYEEQESNANDEDVDSQMKVDPRSDSSVEKLLPLNQDHIIEDASERVPATHSCLDLPKEHNSEELQTNANKTDVDGKMQNRALKNSKRRSQSLSQTPLEVNFDGDPMKAMVIYSHPIYDTNSKPDKQSESSPTHSANSELTPTEDQITDSRDIGANDLDDNQEEGYVDVSDSSPAREREKPILSEAEVFLVAELLSKSRTGSYELIPSMSKSKFALFRNTLSAAPNIEHLTSCGFLISNSFLLSLAKPTNWVSTLHMEVLVSLLSQKLATTLTNQRAAFVQPWFANHLQGKLKSFKAAKIKSRVKWSEPMKQFIIGPNTEWFTDIDTIYLPMIWDSKHWVGLAINLGVWSVEILDPNTDLYEEDEVRRFIEPFVTILPYLIQRSCKPECSQNHGLQPFYWKRLDGLYKNLRSGDCGPVAMKFLEIQTSNNPPENMAKITDKHVDSFRRKYAMNIYEEFVCPLYASAFNNK
ncbi:unnamed protein product [Arabidopsis thaliana]|uniref:(thale cress) hypothetical protein n=1 Tax=Arabidopsis thaliana TaxID=3702 RepID=A0A7G2EBX3_ARATH|nr:unnamed protein product [Arabidopsis thaliana]